MSDRCWWESKLKQLYIEKIEHEIILGLYVRQKKQVEEFENDGFSVFIYSRLHDVQVNITHALTGMSDTFMDIQ